MSKNCEVCGDEARGHVGELYFCCLEHELEYFDGEPSREDYIEAGADFNSQQDGDVDE